MRESTSKPKRKTAAERGSYAPALKAELERASADLVYSSESDRPFEFFSIGYPGRRSPPDAEDFAALIGRDAGNGDGHIEERSMVEFFAHHTATSDPYDSEAQKIRPRYEALMRLLSTKLRDVKVYRVGKVEIECYVVGLDGNGNLAGLKTIALET
ncbi:MAG TPA: nuclease A inhibitor family protein [Gemmatimonadaceae bacterium]|nr:nuclease A inhibitor family protein [Gemmatimonadaceae bacterium]